MVEISWDRLHSKTNKYKIKQIEEALSLPMNISDEMLKNLKAEVRKKLKEESKVTSGMKKNITNQLQALREEEKILFKGYVQGKCDEEMYNEIRLKLLKNAMLCKKQWTGIMQQIPKLTIYVKKSLM